MAAEGRPSAAADFADFEADAVDGPFSHLAQSKTYHHPNLLVAVDEIDGLFASPTRVSLAPIAGFAGDPAPVPGGAAVAPAGTPNVEVAEGQTTASGTWTPAVPQI